MRHRKLGGKLSRTHAHRKALRSSMALALIKHEQIQTTLAKARFIRPFIERCITRARKGNMATRRNLMAILHERRWVDKLCDVLAIRYMERLGGYTRIIKTSFRYGDMAPMAVIEFVDRDLSALGQDSGPTGKKTKRSNDELSSAS